MRRGTGPAGAERGAVMMFVLLAIVLIAGVTISVMQVISADSAGGVESLEADQVFNVTQAGVHYAIGKLQATGANAYAGETVSIFNGTKVLGSAAITVNCIDTGTAPPCNGQYATYRRIISKGTLPVAGPTRTIVAVVQSSTQGGTYGICALSSFNVQGPDATYIYGDIASNGTISLADTGQGTPLIYGDTNTPPAYTGKATAVSTITCAATGGCAAQVQGGVFPNQGGTICYAPPLPTYSNPNSTTPLNIASNTVYTMNSVTGFNWGDVKLAAGTLNGGSNNCLITTDLQIQADPVNPNNTQVVQMNTLQMPSCTRLVILGVGKVDLRIGATTGNDLYVQGPMGGAANGTRFGVTINDKPNTPAPVPVGQLNVYLYSSCLPPGCTCKINSGPYCAGLISHTSGNATFIVPNGSFTIDDAQPFSGAIVANQLNYTGTNGYYLNTTGLAGTASSFNTLRSWKDQ